MKIGISKLAIAAAFTLLLGLFSGVASAAEPEPMDISGSASAALGAQATVQADDLTLYDINSDTVETLNGTYKSKKRVIIGGRGTCPRTKGAVQEARRLSKLDEYKDVIFIVLDCDGDKAAFSKAFSTMATDRVRFYSSNDSTYGQWLGKYTSGHYMLPYFYTIDSSNRLTSWINEITLGWDGYSSKAVEPVLYDAFGIRTDSYAPLVVMAEHHEDLGDYEHYSDNTIPPGGLRQLWYVGFGAGASVSFASSDPQVLSVTSSGALTANREGNATVTASGGGLRHMTYFSVQSDASKASMSDDQSSSAPSNGSGSNASNGSGKNGSSSSSSGKNGSSQSSKDGGSSESSGSSSSSADGTQDMHRLYNPNSGEHFYTADTVERDVLIDAGWNYEGTGWTAPMTSSMPVYRVYNPVAGEHHYTLDANERDMLVGVGWNDEGIGWYSAGDDGTPLFRDYNPNAFANNHNYTADWSEHANLVGLGWNDEGIGWYGV